MNVLEQIRSCNICVGDALIVINTMFMYYSMTDWKELALLFIYFCGENYEEAATLIEAK